MENWSWWTKFGGKFQWNNFGGKYSVENFGGIFLWKFLEGMLYLISLNPFLFKNIA